MKMSWRKGMTWGGAAAVAVGVLVWAFAPRPVAVETALVQSGRFEQVIEEDGRTRVRDRYTVSTPVAARLVRIDLREGDRVRAGQVVAMLLPVAPSMFDERSTREATARYAAATAGVQRAAAALERAGIAAEDATLEARRTESLANEGFVSRARLDSARLARVAALHEQEAARAQRDQAIQEQRVAAAALMHPGQASAGPPLPVRSPVDGVVLKVTQPSEATLPAGAALLDLGDPARLEVVADYLTTDATQALPGRRAVLERWGGPSASGRVRRVEPSAFTKVSALGIEEQRVRVIVDLDRTPPDWKAVGDGYRVTVRIITQSVDEAVLAPVGALFPFADGGTAVYRVEEGRARLQPVELAGRNGNQAWVLSGLRPGQAVVVYPPPAVVDGGRVAVRAR